MSLTTRRRRPVPDPDGQEAESAFLEAVNRLRAEWPDGGSVTPRQGSGSPISHQNI